MKRRQLLTVEYGCEWKALCLVAPSRGLCSRSGHPWTIFTLPLQPGINLGKRYERSIIANM